MTSSTGARRAEIASIRRSSNPSNPSASYLTAYRLNNVLRTEVSGRDVAELAAEMCGPLFARTTGAQLPLDGGNDCVI